MPVFIHVSIINIIYFINLKERKKRIMKNVNYITEKNVLSTVKQLTTNGLVIADHEIYGQMLEKYNPCIKVQCHSRKDLHTKIEELKPSVVFLLHYSERTVRFINSILPNTIVYMTQIDEDGKRISRYVDELSDLKP